MPDQNRSLQLRHLTTPEERRRELTRAASLTDEEESLLSGMDPISTDRIAERIENGIGVLNIPVGVAEHFVINGRAIPGIPMATEELSVIAAAGKGAKLAAHLGGFKVVTPSYATVRGHVVYGFESLVDAQRAFERVQNRLFEFKGVLRPHDPLVKHGGGLLDVSPEYTCVGDGGREFLIITIEINPAESMGANAVTRLGEHLAKMIKSATGLEATGAICTNHDSGWPVTASASWHKDVIGEIRLQKILDWQRLARVDHDRVVTHNKGIENGTVAVGLATGQDTRAIEACVHATNASRRYMPLTSYEYDPESGVLRGTLKLILPVATKGGMTDHPQAIIYRKMMGAETARDLAGIMAAVGLAQNFAALYCLSGEGIPASHAILTKAQR